MVNRLPVPFSDDELLLLLLYVSVHSVAHLRALCAKRFLAEEESSAMSRYQNKMKGQIASVEEEEFVEENDSESIAAFKLMKC